MRLQAKITATFAALAVVTFGVAVLAWWKVANVESAVHEVAVVRLPSIRGLNLVGEAMFALRHSEELLATGALTPEQRDQERLRQEGAWRTFERGWEIYEPLPQTSEEAALWAKFVPTARGWQAEYRQELTRLFGGSAADLSARSERTQSHREGFEETARLLTALAQLNYGVANAASEGSLVRGPDLNDQRLLMLVAGLAGLIGAGCLAIVVGRVLTQPVRKLAEQVAQHADPSSGNEARPVVGDEVTEIAKAFARTAEDLRSSETRLESLSANLPHSVIYQLLRDADGTKRFVYLSAPAERLLGVTREKLLGDAAGFYERVHPEDLDRSLAAEEDSAKKLSSFSTTARIRQADGQWRWWQFKSTPRQVGNGGVVWDGLATDVHEQILADARLIESEARFRAVFDHSPDAIGVSRKGLTVFVNPAFSQLFGYHPIEDALNRPIFDFVAESSHDLVRKRMADRAAGQATPEMYELLCRHRDGTVFHAEIRTLTFTLGGEPHTLVMHRDVTDRRRFVDDIGKSNRALKRVRDAHRHLAHASDETSLLKELCELFVRDNDYCFAWVATDAGAQQGLQPVAQAGSSAKPLDHWRESWPAVTVERLSFSETQQPARSIVARNFLNDPALDRWKQDALKHGYASSIVLPLRRGAHLIGFVALFSSERTAFDEAEAELLGELGEDIAFSLVSIRERVEHERTERKVRGLLAQAEQSRGALLSILEDQKLVEDALHRSEERFRSAMLNSAIGMALAEADGRCSEVNPALCRILGYEREELTGRTIESLTAPEDQAKQSRLLAQLLDGTMSTYELEKRLVRKDGSTVWVQANVSIVRDLEKRPWHFISQIQDISERLRTAAAREEILTQLRLALQAGRLGTFRRNVVTGEGIWDEQTFKLMSRPLSEGTPSRDEFVAAIHPHDRERMSRRLRRLPPADELSYGYRVQALDGSERHFVVHSMAEPATEPGREPEWVIGVITEITDLIRIQEDLATAAQRLKLSMSIAKLGVWRSELQSEVNEWNERMFEIYGLDPKSPVPELPTFRSWILEDDRPAVEMAWKTMLLEGHDFRVRYRVRRSDGTVRHIEAHAVVQFDDVNRPKVVIGVNSDITEIVDAAAESARLREQLQQAQKMEALGTMAAGVAHDFNNLLTGINGFVGLAASSLPPGHEAGDLLKQALRGAVNARDLVRRILDFSRGRGDQARIAIDLSELIRDTAPLISAALPSNVSLSVALEKDVAFVVADPGQIQQVLLNLCINGSHAIGSKKGTLTIRLKDTLFTEGSTALPRGGRPGKYVCLSVTDSGSGMDDAIKRRLFEPFFTTKKPGVGTGLGLSIVRDIVNGHQGAIDLTSTVGEGTTFFVYLPAAAPVKPTRAEYPQLEREQETVGRILVINPAPAVAMVLRLSLQKTGYSPEVYTSTADGWKRLALMPNDFDLVMVDAGIENPGARDFLQRVRSMRPLLPVIITVDELSQSDFAESSLDEFTWTLNKPFEVHVLRTGVRNALAGAVRDGRDLP